MINPYFALSGIGMMLVGLLPLLWWRYRTLVPWRDFWFGVGIYTSVGIAIITGAYVGLRTGFFESGGTYLFALKKKLHKYDFQQAVAFGLGFGGAEAVLLGLISFLNVAVLLAFPQIIDLLPPGQRAAVLAQLTLPTVVVLAPIIERAFTLMIHIFCAVLVIQAVKTRRVEYFLLSFLFKTLTDGMLPMLTLSFDRTSVAGVYSIEAFVVALGAVSLAGMFWLRGKYGKKYKKVTGKTEGLFLVSFATALIILFSVFTAQPNLASPIERRPVNFDDFEARYDFMLNGSKLGHSEFEFFGKANYNGRDAYIIKEIANLSTKEYAMHVTGTLYVTLDARPLFYNMTIHKNGDVKNVVCEFEDGVLTQTVLENNETQTLRMNVNPDTFLIANNMISHWALMFRAAKLEPQQTYIAHIYSPNIAAELVRSFEISDVQQVKINSHTHEAYVFKEETGNLNYVTPDGLLLKIENHVLVIILSNGNVGSGVGLFR
jgi:uncharacterized membrane protein YhfC